MSGSGENEDGERDHAVVIASRDEAQDAQPRADADARAAKPPDAPVGGAESAEPVVRASAPPSSGATAPLRTTEPRSEAGARDGTSSGATTRPRWVAPVAIALLLVLLAAFSIGLEAISVRDEESTLWSNAESERTAASWQRYVDWAEGIRERGGARSMLARELTLFDDRESYASTHVLLAGAAAIIAREDWPALCALRTEHPGTEADEAATQALRARLESATTSYRASARAHAMRANALAAITSALEAVRADDPCADVGLLHVRHSIDPAADDLDRRIPGGATVRDVLERNRLGGRSATLVDSIDTELRDALGGAYGLTGAREEETANRAHLAVEIATVVHADTLVATTSGVELPAIALRVSIRFFVRPDGAVLPTEPDYQTTAELALPAELVRELSSASGAAAAETAYRDMLSTLYARLTERVREELGLAAWSGPSSPYYDCSDAEPLPVGRRVRGTTRGAVDVTYGSCSAEYESGRRSYDSGCDDCADETLLSPEVVYRLIVPERSIAAVQAFADGRDVVTYIRSECASLASELACGAEGAPASAVLDAGVYYVFVDGSAGSSGRFELAASLHDAIHPPHACDSAAVLVAGESTTVDTSHGLDHMEGSCGGVGAPERVYALDVAVPSRLRCTRTSDIGGVVYVRSSCGRPESEIACASAVTSPLYATLAPGRHFVVVDGAVPGDLGRHRLRCDLAAIPTVSAVDAEACDSPEAATIPGTIEADTFSARDDLHGSCGGAGPDLVYRLEVTTRSRLRATPTGADTVLYVESTCGDASTEIACVASGPLEAELDPGSYFLVVDSGATSFGARSIAIELSDL